MIAIDAFVKHSGQNKPFAFISAAGILSCTIPHSLPAYMTRVQRQGGRSEPRWTFSSAT